MEFIISPGVSFVTSTHYVKQFPLQSVANYRKLCLYLIVNNISRIFGVCCVCMRNINNKNVNNRPQYTFKQFKT